jgi:hypothetical protein
VGRGTTQCNWFVMPIPIQTVFYNPQFHVDHFFNMLQMLDLSCTFTKWHCCWYCLQLVGVRTSTTNKPWFWQSLSNPYWAGCIIIISTQVSRTHTYWNVWQNVTWSVVQSNFCSAGMICMGLQCLVWKCGTSLETEF